ncbi:spectrin beta non-erythrocytic 1-like isoform X1 [Labeo rohita]|uniref:Spectrin beta non-erythrocytic 1-like isoform X1 n=1 Tax=Labeo rohita TaxID=84645 RepID=A0A498MPJ7_LABRO|nr:spectrin beta non-erythrocytic 1-like isoform X1 [Labeo rohita]RXN23459.1 spectrin beta non-erythrocytic 1-like isoform X1 [Labeo rohita]
MRGMRRWPPRVLTDQIPPYSPRYTHSVMGWSGMGVSDPPPPQPHPTRLGLLAAVEFPAATMSTISPTDFDSVEIQQQYNDINNRWDIAAETEWDNENSSARLFERSRIKALAAYILCAMLMTLGFTLVE